MYGTKLIYSIEKFQWSITTVTDFYITFQELFGTEGVEVVIHYLRTNSSFLNSGLGHHRLLLSAVDCVWSVYTSGVRSDARGVGKKEEAGLI